mgnify:CR=1 FL=1
MALSINPLSQLVAKTANSVVADLTNVGGQIKAGVGDALGKMNLDSTINSLSGGLGSGLNGLTGNLSSMAGDLSGAVGSVTGQASGLLAGAQSALGGLGSVASSLPGAGALDTLKTAAGSISNVTADVSGALNKLGAGGSGGLLGGMQSLAGAISSAAGVLNNVLSLKRAGGLPKGGELLGISSTTKVSSQSKDDWRVRITLANWGILGNSPMFSPLVQTDGVVWPYLPNITISTKANYTSVETVHSNYPYQAYKNSQVDDISISGEFSCETEQDAAYWIAATTFFRTATKMFFGQGENAGNPPIICILRGYGASVFNNSPVVVKSFSVDLKDDVNYITCNTWGTSTRVPILSTITVVVTPVYSRSELRRFSLTDFAKGKLTTSGNVGYL